MLSLFICTIVWSTTTAMLNAAVDVTVQEGTDAPTTTNKYIPIECNSDTGYTYYPTNSCYKLYKRALPWVQANAICTQENGYLAILNDEKEAQTVSSIVRNAEGDVQNAWVGHRDRNSNGHWSSSHGHPQNEIFNVWSQPRAHYLEFRSCGAIQRNVTLIDYSCLDALYFVCEKDF